MILWNICISILLLSGFLLWFIIMCSICVFCLGW